MRRGTARQGQAGPGKADEVTVLAIVSCILLVLILAAPFVASFVQRRRR